MAHSIWTGSISFGLVTFPVKLMTAVRQQRVNFHMLSPEGNCRLRRKLYCPENGKEYDFGETARGVEIAPDQYVIVQQDELDQIKPEKGDTIDLEAFIDIQEVDPIYWDRCYYIVPGKGGAKAYALLERAMRESGRVAIGQFVMRERQHLVTLRPKDGVMVLHIMNYADEVQEAEDLGDLPGDVKLTDKEIKMAKQLIESLTEAFAPEQYEDTYRKKVEELIEAKAEGEDVSAVATVHQEEGPPVINLMQALRESLEKSKADKPKRRKSA